MASSGAGGKSKSSNDWCSSSSSNNNGSSNTKIWTGSLILKKVHRPDLENLRHRDNSLKLWIFEAKRLPPKKRYFCEICLDHILYTRTTSKEKTVDADPFWGEPFEFSNLQDIALVTVKLFREADRKKKKDKNQVIGEVQLPVHDIGTAVEQWYCLEPASLTSKSTGTGGSGARPDQPCIRLRSHYISTDVLPLQCYRGLQEFLMRQSEALVSVLEPRLALRDKELLAAGIVSVAHASGRAEPLLADLVMQEMTASANDLLVFRGNSIATKAIEFYLRLTGCDYLRQVMTEPLSILLRADPACEVDPQRVDSAETLASNQRCLREYAELFWSRIQQSAGLIPPEISKLFALIRQRLAETRRQELGDTLVSASLFLRLVCPAILGPTLFGLTRELPSQRAARALTLIAKTVQNLANGALYGAKEAYMQFMNRFLEDHSTEMRLFLKAASRSGQHATGATPATAAGIDLGCELAQLHSLLSTACLGQQQQQLPQDPCIAALSGHLTALTHCLRHGGYAGPSAQSGASGAAGSSAAQSEEDWVYSNVAESSPPPQPPQPPQKLPLPPPPPPQSTQLPPQPLQQQRPPSGSQRPGQQQLQQQQQYQHRHHQQPYHQHQQQQHQGVQEDWKKMLEEANIFAAGGASSGPVVSTSAVGGAASTTGSSGYQSFSATSPVQFFNPTYQKGGLPPLRSQSELPSSDEQICGPVGVGYGNDDDIEAVEGDYEDDDDDDLVDSPRRVGGSSSSEMASSEASSIGPSAPAAALAKKKLTVEVGSQIRWNGEEAASAADAMRLKTRSLGPAASQPACDPQQMQQRVRMGVRATQPPLPHQPSHQSPHQPPHQPSNQQAAQVGQRSQLEYETELQKLQRELSETRHRLQATEARLRSNEQEKVQLVAQFQQQPQQQSPQQAASIGSPSSSQQQMHEILQRLQSLETSFRQGAGGSGNKQQDFLDSI